MAANKSKQMQNHRSFQCRENKDYITQKLTEVDRDLNSLSNLINDIKYTVSDVSFDDTIKTLQDICDKFERMADSAKRKTGVEDLYAEGIMDGISIAVAKFKGCDVHFLDGFGSCYEDPRVPEAYYIKLTEKKKGEKE